MGPRKNEVLGHWGLQGGAGKTTPQSIALFHGLLETICFNLLSAENIPHRWGCLVCSP